jgi:hypothetical protein
MTDPILITLIITTVANLIMNVISHVKRSSCWGSTFETYEPIPDKVNLE